MLASRAELTQGQIDRTVTKKKLCILVPAHWAAMMGGSEYQVKCLLDRLVERNQFEIFYLARHINRDYSPPGYTIMQVAEPGGIRRFGEFLDARPLIKVLRALAPDVIYQRVGCGYTGTAAYYARRHHCRLIWHVAHEMEVQPFDWRVSNNMVFRYVDKKFLEYGIKRATGIIVQTARQRDLLAYHYRRIPIAQIPNAHPAPTELSVKADHVEVVWIANLKPWKQPELFVRLAEDLKSLDHIRFTMIGSAAGGETRHARLLEQIRKLRNVTYLGVCPQETVNAVLARAHIFVNTSIYEGFPNTFIQAWMRDVPVVSLNVDPDNVLTKQRIGFLCGTYENLRRQVVHLAENPGFRQQMGSDGRAYALKTHSMQNLDKLIEVIDAH